MTDIVPTVPWNPEIGTRIVAGTIQNPGGIKNREKVTRTELHEIIGMLKL